VLLPVAVAEPDDRPFVLERGRYGGPAFRGLDRAAVVVVDMSNDFGHPQGVYARHGVVCDSFPAAVAAVGGVLEAATNADVPTFFATQVVYAGPDGRAVAGGGLVEGRPWLRDEGLRPGSWGVQSVDELPRTDYVVEKPRASAFVATPLELLLRGLDIETLIVGGCYTNQCVESTVRDAWARDFRVVVISDGVAAFDPRLNDATLESLRPLTTQLSSAEIVALLENPAPDTP
jgi:ureidoacrylate peracid hydrolase